MYTVLTIWNLYILNRRVCVASETMTWWWILPVLSFFYCSVRMEMKRYAKPLCMIKNMSTHGWLSRFLINWSIVSLLGYFNFSLAVSFFDGFKYRVTRKYAVFMCLIGVEQDPTRYLWTPQTTKLHFLIFMIILIFRRISHNHSTNWEHHIYKSHSFYYQ